MEIQSTDPQFLALWDRVRPVAPVEEPPWQELLLQAIRRELVQRRHYLALGLTACAREGFYRANLLRTACFLCFDAPHCPSIPPVRGQTPSLPALFQREGDMEQDYLRLGTGCSSEVLGGVFARCAQSCRRTRQLLWHRAEQTPGG